MQPGEDQFLYLCRTLVGSDVRVVTYASSDSSSFGSSGVTGTLLDASASVVTVQALRLGGARVPVHIRTSAIISIEIIPAPQ
jgi:hypothetical protein